MQKRVKYGPDVTIYMANTEELGWKISESRNAIARWRCDGGVYARVIAAPRKADQFFADGLRLHLEYNGYANGAYARGKSLKNDLTSAWVDAIGSGVLVGLRLPPEEKAVEKFSQTLGNFVDGYTPPRPESGRLGSRAEPGETGLLGSNTGPGWVDVRTDHVEASWYFVEGRDFVRVAAVPRVPDKDFLVALRKHVEAAGFWITALVLNILPTGKESKTEKDAMHTGAYGAVRITDSKEGRERFEAVMRAFADEYRTPPQPNGNTGSWWRFPWSQR